ncbi:MAG: GNAT family N-acetyltransferase [Chloroherpetonaceae bacterium]|nr:GNAT family N-acetyltransferase [Chthonomonadaceae bacterium]MDW8208882.1 GNAT family N-acetyltransferase [Chloroherpetonaceae bacterium]
MADLRFSPDAMQIPLPRGIRLRRGTDSDEFATFDVMRRAMGCEMTWSHHAAMRAHLRTSPQCSFWVAEEVSRAGRARPVGYARSTVRERVWNLNEFFLLPEYQRRGIGGALLACCLADGDSASAETRYVLASQNARADALYIRRAGCFPRIPMLLLAGSLQSLVAPAGCQIQDTRLTLPTRRAQHNGATLLAEPLFFEGEAAEAINALDRRIVGYARPEEHRHWAREMGGPQGSARIFRRRSPDTGAGGPIAGYAYLGPHASGPILAEDPSDLPGMIAHIAAVHCALPASRGDFDPSPEHHFAVPGTNEQVLRWLLECRWQIVFQYLFMSSRPFGAFEHYVCHNPLYTL